jgi:hypothetical protein
MEFNLTSIAWEKVIIDLEEKRNARKDYKTRQILADAYSLSALFCQDFPTATKRIQQAILIEPLNPLHQYRYILLFLHFGQWTVAFNISENLKNSLNGFAIFEYLRALIALKANQKIRALNITNQIIKNHPDFYWAKFLNSEISFRDKFKNPGKYLREIRKQDIYHMSWIDLFSKIIVMHQIEGITFVSKFIKETKIFSNESKKEQIIQNIILWHTSPIDDLKNLLAEIPAESRREQMFLLCYFNNAKRNRECDVYLKDLYSLYKQYPDRKAVRRLYVAALNHYAVEESAKGRYKTALRIIEICIHIEPYNSIHYQNRAALFTLLREKEPYHMAWEELDKLQYRLMLVGRIDQKTCQTTAKRHRMFAQQARMSSKEVDKNQVIHLGILREEKRVNSNSEEFIVSVNSARIESDPELFRQWIYNKEAELLFYHLSLGTDPNRFLLENTDFPSAKAKLNGLFKLTNSLGVLADEEGVNLALKIEQIWKNQFKTFKPSYQNSDDDNEIKHIVQNHLQTLSDIALICHEWTPNPKQETIVDELINFLNVEINFLSTQMIFSKENKDETAYSIRFFRHWVIEILELEKEAKDFFQTERSNVANKMAAQLLINLSISTFEDSKKNNPDSQIAARRALIIIDKAKKLSTSSAEIEYYAARFFYIGDFYSEARKAITRFYQLNKNKDSQYVKNIEEIQGAIDKADKKDEKSYFSKDNFDNISFEGISDKIQELERDLVLNPSSFALYKELSSQFIKNNQIQKALVVSENALAHCLSRELQVKSRLLNIEVIAFGTLGAKYLNEIRLYLSDVENPLKNVLEKLSGEQTFSYSQYFLLGLCHLKLKEPKFAENAFRASLDICKTQIHFVIIKKFLEDIEEAFYNISREKITNFLKIKNYDEALNHTVQTMSKMIKPEIFLIDIAEIYLSLIIFNFQHNTNPPEMPNISLSVPWNNKLQDIFKINDSLDKDLKLVELASEFYPLFKERSNKLIMQINQIKDQLNVSDVLLKSGDLIREEKYEEALKILSIESTLKESNSRILRQKAIIFIKLGRYEEADKIKQILENIKDEIAIDFIDKYKTIKFNNQIEVTRQFLKRAKIEEARKLLNEIVAEDTKEKLEKHYCLSFAFAIEAYHAQKQKNIQQAELHFKYALDEIEPLIESARKYEFQSMIELYEKLSKDLNDLNTY